jgi:type VI secretion system secreted protein VgrG
MYQRRFASLRTFALPLLAVMGAVATACVGAPAESRDDVRRTDRGGLNGAAPVLGSAQSFAVLGGSTVTNLGATTITGDLGVDPGLAITGFPPGIVMGGAVHAGDALALQAQTDVTAAYGVLASEVCSRDLTGQDLGGLTLSPGVYCFASSAQLTGALTLDAQGDADAVFVFEIASTLTSASNASVKVINGGGDCGVFWQVGSSATLGTGTAFVGSVLALASITVTTGATISGRALARNGAVTMDQNGTTDLDAGATS